MALPIGFRGATSTFYRLEPGVVLKSPRESKVFGAAEIEQSFSVERQILEILGSHCRIVGYLGWKEDAPRGLKLAEASHGSLQQYLYDNPVIPSSLREKWCRQAISAVAFVHSKGVIHSDLRPDNFLVHATTATSLDLWLCDFGTSECKQYGLNEGRLPYSGFYDPNLAPQPGQAMDIFSLASVLYTILTGHWPHRDPGRFQTIEQVDDYHEKVDRLFGLGEFPDVDGLFMGEVIMNCWEHKYWDVKDIERDLS